MLSWLSFRIASSSSSASTVRGPYCSFRTRYQVVCHVSHTIASCGSYLKVTLVVVMKQTRSQSGPPHLRLQTHFVSPACKFLGLALFRKSRCSMFERRIVRSECSARAGNASGMRLGARTTVLSTLRGRAWLSRVSAADSFLIFHTPLIVPAALHTSHCTFSTS